MKTFSIESWQQTADYILAPLVAEEMLTKGHSHYWKTIEAHLLAMHFPEGRWRLVYLATQDLIISQKAVHITTLQTALEGQVSPDYIALLFTLCQKNTSLLNGVFDANLGTLREYGERAYAIDKLNAGIIALTAGDNRGQDAVIAETIGNLTTTSASTIKHETAIEMGNDFESFMNEAPERTMKTYVEVVDNWMGGIAVGEFMAIVGAMKQRKTTLLLNMLINLARQRHSCSLMMFESNKRMINAALVAMLAMEFVLANGLYGKADYNAQGVTLGKCEQIWVKSLVKLQRNFFTLGLKRAEAVRYGISEFKKLEAHLRIYDRSKDGGGLSDTASAYRLALRDKALYDTEFLALDHAQRINEVGKSDYEKLLKIVPFMEALARREDIAVCLLAQLAADKAEGTGDSHASGVRGGTILDEAVDSMFSIVYRGKSDNGRDPSDVLRITAQQSRYGDGGAGTSVYVAIDPNTGLFPHGGKKLEGVHADGGNVLWPDTHKPSTKTIEAHYTEKEDGS